MRSILLWGAGSFVATMHLVSCQSGTSQTSGKGDQVKPRFVSETVAGDTDDPAIWINKEDRSKSLVIGTDKGGDSTTGGLYVFDLNGKILHERTVFLKRPNNVDIAYEMVVSGTPIDIAVCTERNTNSIRVFSLPELNVIDGGGIPVFEDDSLRAPMGVALYTSPDKKIYAIVGRKNGTSGSYLWQYELYDSNGSVKGRLMKKFGDFSGKNEIESIAVDNELGYVYYSDEGAGIRKYYAHPDSSSVQLALFGDNGFAQDHEGISIYKKSQGEGYILVSDQQANQFHVFTREGTKSDPHDHSLIGVIKVSTSESDGSEVTSEELPGFTTGLFVAMSDDRTFQFYHWDDLMKQLSNH
jgi:3-phytase